MLQTEAFSENGKIFACGIVSGELLSFMNDKKRGGFIWIMKSKCRNLHFIKKNTQN